jgi:hypothetical protein
MGGLTMATLNKYGELPNEVYVVKLRNFNKYRLFWSRGQANRYASEHGGVIYIYYLRFQGVTDAA